MGGHSNLMKGKFLYTHGLPILYENNLNKLSEEDKIYVEDFMKIQKGKKIWKITEFYNEVVFRVPMNKQAEYHSDVGGNTYVYYWKFPGKVETLGAYHSVELSYIFNNSLDETISDRVIINSLYLSLFKEIFLSFYLNQREKILILNK